MLSNFLVLLPKNTRKRFTSTQKVMEVLNLFIEIGVSDCRATFYSVKNRLSYYLFGDPKYINSKDLKVVRGKLVKVVIGVHGEGGDSSSFHPLFKKLHREGLSCNLFTVEYSQTVEKPLPVEPLLKKLEQIEQLGFELDITILGHSAGALIATKLIWLVGAKHKISYCFSIAGRQRDSFQNQFPWFSAGVLPEAVETYEKISSDPDKVKWHCVYGKNDGIVPEDSALPCAAIERMHVEGYGHLGILYASEFEENFIQKMHEWDKS